MITQEDLILILQQSAAPQTVKIKIEVLNGKKKVIDCIEHISNCNIKINVETDIRRSCTITLQPSIFEELKLDKDRKSVV